MVHFIYCYAECRYDECRILFIVMLNIIVLSVVMLNFVLLGVFILNVVKMGVVAPARGPLSSEHH